MIEVRVFDQATPTTGGVVLEREWGRASYDVLNGTGSGQVAIHPNDAQAAQVTVGKLVKFYLDGSATPYFGFLIERRPQVTISDRERGGRKRSALGRGLGCLLQWGVTEPELGVNRRDNPETRLFNFASGDFNDSAWSNAVQTVRQDSGSSIWTTDKGNAPDGWPATAATAYWIWSRSGGMTPMPIGRSYFRKQFTITQTKSYRIWCTADDGIEVYLDGKLHISETQAFMWAQTKYVDLLLEPGTHTLAVMAENIQRDAAIWPPIGESPASFVLAVTEMNEGGNEPGTMVVGTDSTWKALDYPAVPPTMTVGEIMRVLIDEWQARGGGTAIIKGFTDGADFLGAAWATPVDLKVPVGRHYLAILDGLVEAQACDWRFDAATHALRLYNHATLGTVKAIAMVEGTHFRDEVTHEEEGVLANAGLAHLHTGAYTWVEAVTAEERREIAVEMGTAPSTDQANRQVGGIIADHGDPADIIRAPFVQVPGALAYTDWQVGDSLTLPTSDYATEVTRILELQVIDVDPGQDGTEPVAQSKGTQRFTLIARQGPVGV